MCQHSLLEIYYEKSLATFTKACIKNKCKSCFTEFVKCVTPRHFDTNYVNVCSVYTNGFVKDELCYIIHLFLKEMKNQNDKTNKKKVAILMYSIISDNFDSYVNIDNESFKLTKIMCKKILELSPDMENDFEKLEKTYKKAFFDIKGENLVYEENNSIPCRCRKESYMHPYNTRSKIRRC